MAEERSSRLRRFFAAFHQMSSIFGAGEINRNKSKLLGMGSVRDWHGSGTGVRGVLVFWCSGTRKGSDAGYWKSLVADGF
jgi:hypothetical protein